MRQIREVLRLTFEEGRSQRLVARALGVVRATVARVLKRFAGAGLAWPPDPPLSDAELERKLYGGPAHQGTAKEGARPDYAAAVVELARKGVTRQRLWQEYRDRLAAGEGIGYSVFCAELSAYRADRDLAYRHDHVPGERGYFDFAGLTLKYRGEDGRVRAAQIFTAALGWSNATFAYAFADQKAGSWLEGQQRAFAAFGGVPKIGVPDNPKALIAKADRYEPKLTPVYRDFAAHHGITIVPARARKPKDKATVEGAVKHVSMRILAAARDRVFDTLGAVNTWLAQELVALNAAPFQKRVGSRSALLAEERKHLQPLPTQRFEAPTYLLRKVARDYHVDVHRQYYSVPCVHAGQAVEVRLTAGHVEILRADQRIALHVRAPALKRFVTDPAHLPEHHRAFSDPQIERRAAAAGPAVSALIAALFSRRRHPETAIRSAQGILSLKRDHGAAALDAACAYALRLDAIGYHHVRRLLQCARAPVAVSDPPTHGQHAHLRGADYFGSAANDTHQEAHHAA